MRFFYDRWRNESVDCSTINSVQVHENQVSNPTKPVQGSAYSNLGRSKSKQIVVLVMYFSFVRH